MEGSSPELNPAYASEAERRRTAAALIHVMRFRLVERLIRDDRFSKMYFPSTMDWKMMCVPIVEDSIRIVNILFLINIG